VIRPAWDQRIARAQTLADLHPSAGPMLRFYAQLLATQRRLLDTFDDSPLDVLVRKHFPRLLDFLELAGTNEIAVRAAELRLQGEDGWPVLMADCPDDFFARAFLQPYGEWLGEACPGCRNQPQVSTLRDATDGARRNLVCALCHNEWNFHRIFCPACHEQGFDELPVYTAAEFPHLRVEACDTCKSYLLCVDMTKDEMAVPLVDELAAVPLHLWAQEQGYRRIRTNLLGL
jgi:FdhE protein